MAHIGYPIIGDGKYGINQVNKYFGKKYQELESYRIVFEDAIGTLSYLKGKEFVIKWNRSGAHCAPFFIFLLYIKKVNDIILIRLWLKECMLLILFFERMRRNGFN